LPIPWLVDVGGLDKATHLQYLQATVVGLLPAGANKTTDFNLVAVGGGGARGWIDDPAYGRGSRAPS